MLAYNFKSQCGSRTVIQTLLGKESVYSLFYKSETLLHFPIARESKIRGRNLVGESEDVPLLDFGWSQDRRMSGKHR